MTTVWWLLGGGCIRGLSGNGKNTIKIKFEKQMRKICAFSTKISNSNYVYGLVCSVCLFITCSALSASGWLNQGVMFYWPKEIKYLYKLHRILWLDKLISKQVLKLVQFLELLPKIYVCFTIRLCYDLFI